MKDILIEMTSPNPKTQQRYFKELEKMAKDKKKTNRYGVTIHIGKMPEDLGQTIRLCGKMYRTTIEHNLGYRPFISMWAGKVGKNEEFPYWDFRQGYISETDFYFYHEKYSKKEFKFYYSLYKEGPKILVETKAI